MNHLKVFRLFCMVYFLLLIYQQSFGKKIDASNLNVIAGTSAITGEIKTTDHINKDNIYVYITVPHNISGEFVKYKALVDHSGKFSLDSVAIETDTCLVSLYTSLNPEKYLFVKLINGEVTHLNITFQSDFIIKDIHITPAMNTSDVTRGFEVMLKALTHKGNRSIEPPLYNQSVGYFQNYVQKILSERLEVIHKDTLISNDLKELLSKDLRLSIYNAHVFDYENEMYRNFYNLNGNEDQKPDLQKIDRSYFHFLKDFDLNDPQYLNSLNFLDFQKEILQNETLGIPMIGDSDIPSWLKKVKAILSDLVGFDHGSYYDILAANAYARQLNEEVSPLTVTQKENITSYWKDGAIAQILFRKNKEVIALNQLKSPVVVKDVSLVSANKVLETIIAQHQDQVVFVDLWATWCAPCLEAMQQFRSTKQELKGKGIVFVYLTNSSSPVKLWEEKIKGIGNEHYYLTDAQWTYLMNHYELEGIPSYLLFNKQGVLVQKFTGFPGNVEVRDMINALL
ncbi:MAG: TlpA family protein disulfide reductase [Sphingobacteriales bacterium]|nr:TlpA family protein disulfide reductase [Sphingobacteriales bacterium]